MKRILALDGGGIRGVYTLEVLLRMEAVLREHYREQYKRNGVEDADARAEQFVLRDHFDFFAGTSTGAIIATLLCWGEPVQGILDMYVKFGRKMFQPVPWYRPVKKFLMNRYEAVELSEILKDLFLELDGKPVKRDENGKPIEKGEPACLGSKHLLSSEERDRRKYLLVVVRNQTTGSAWPLTNNPDAKYNDRDHAECNLNIPLWELVRASTAAPTYFEAAQLLLGKKPSLFVDGSITPYSNPAAIAAQTAVLPGYRVNWTPGPENIRLVSVGTLTFSSELPVSNPRLWLGFYAAQIPAALLTGTAWQQDYLCRCMGQCIFGETIDSEVGSLIGDPHVFMRAWFSYVRYNRTYRATEMAKVLRENPRLARIDAIDAIPYLRDIGKSYADENVRLEHLV
jgi:uncharacterized protein